MKHARCTATHANRRHIKRFHHPESAWRECMCLCTVCTHTAVILPIIKVKDKWTHTDVNADRKNQKNRHNMVETDQIQERTRTHTFACHCLFLLLIRHQLGSSVLNLLSSMFGTKGVCNTWREQYISIPIHANGSCLAGAYFRSTGNDIMTTLWRHKKHAKSWILH